MRRPIDRYVDSLIRRHRPRSFAPSADDLAVARIAIELAAAGPEGQQPRESFVEDLRRRLADQEANAQIEQSEPAAAPPASRGGSWNLGRRRLLTVAAATAAAGAVGATADHLLAGPAAEPAAQAELKPSDGTWQTVAYETDLPENSALHFDLGAVAGFVRRTADGAEAVSGACTHQGCALRLLAPRAELACPCHGATFTLAGESLTHPHNSRPLPALPKLPVRIHQGQVQVLAPDPTPPTTAA